MKLRELNYEHYILSTRPTLWLPLYWKDGNTFLSSDGYGHVATVTGATWGSQGRTFAVDDLINLDAVVASLAASTQGTIELWAKMPDVTPAAIQALISFGDTQAPIELLTIWQNIAGTTSFYCQDAGTIQWVLTTNATVLADNTYAHICGVQNGTSPVLYINGTAPAQTFTTSTDKTDWFASLSNIDNGRLGCYNINGVGNTAFLTATIGEVRIYNRALSADEVKNNYLASRRKYQ